MYVFLLPERQKDEAWEPSRKQRSSGNRGAPDGKVLALFIVFEVLITKVRYNGEAAMFWWWTENAARS
jgi:hypothetical protein